MLSEQGREKRGGAVAIGLQLVMPDGTAAHRARPLSVQPLADTQVTENVATVQLQGVLRSLLANGALAACKTTNHITQEHVAANEI